MNTYLDAVEKNFSAEQAARIILASRQDWNAWKVLQDSAFYEKFHASLNNDIQNWSLARMAVQTFETPIDINRLRKDLNFKLPGNLASNALKEYRHFINQENTEFDIHKAGMIALALRERRRVTGNWKGINTELFSQNDDHPESYWGTIIACLVGMIPDPVELFKELFSDPKYVTPAILIICHALLSLPYSIEVLAGFVTKILEDSNIEVQYKFLSYLDAQGRKELVQTVITDLLNQSPERKKKQPPHTDSEELIQRILTEKRIGILESLYGNQDIARSHFLSAHRTINEWLGDFYSYYFDTISDNDVVCDENFNQFVSAIQSDNQAFQRKKIRKLNTNSQSSTESDGAAAGTGIMDSLQQAFKEFQSGNLDEAIEKARGWVSEIDKDSKDLGDENVSPINGLRIISILREMGLNSEALIFARLIEEKYPANEAVVLTIRDILLDLQDYDTALNYARLLKMAKPFDSSSHLKLAECYQKKGLDEEAFHTLSKFSGSDFLSPEAELAFAKSAFKTGHYNEVKASCKRVNESGNNEDALTLLAKTCIANGETEDAIQYYNILVKEFPNNESGWCDLAGLYLAAGRMTEAEEFARRGFTFHPESAEINAILGKLLSASGKYEEAIPYLFTATQLCNSAEISLELGKALLQVNRLEDATMVLQAARTLDPENHQLTFVFAQVFKNQDTDKTLNILEEIIHSSDAQNEWINLYAELVLDQLFGHNLAERKSALKRIGVVETLLIRAVQNEPDNYITQLFLAEALRATGETEKAYQIFQKLRTINIDSIDAVYSHRALVGLGEMAVEMRDPQTAIAMLNQAVIFDPNNVAVYRALAKAQTQTGLKSEALSSAQHALKLAPDDIENLSWFAQMAMELGVEDEAIDVLHCAMQLAPQSSEFLIKAAEIQWQLQDVNGVKETLFQLRDLGGLSVNDWRRMGRIYILLEDDAAALICFEQALNLNELPTVDQLCEMACLNIKNGNTSAALQYMQQLTGMEPSDSRFVLLLIDLLVMEQRFDEALSILKPLAETGELSIGNGAFNHVDSGTHMLPEAWRASLQTSKWMIIRSALIQRKLGDWQEALNILIRWSDNQTTDIFFDFLICELSMVAMQPDTALKFCRKWMDQISLESSIDSDKADWWELGARIGIACNLAEISLNSGEEVNAGRYVHELVIQNLQHPRLLALQSRLMVRRGDWKSADEFYGKAVIDLKSAQAKEETGRLWDYYGIGDAASLDSEIWLTNAAWDLHRWQEAIQMINVYHQAHPLEPSANLQFAKLYIKLIERQQICDLLECSRNSIWSLSIPRDIQTSVMNALQIASLAVNSWEPTYWLARAKTAFELNQENLESLAKIQPVFEDGAPYAMGLWKLNQKDKILQLINAFSPTPALYLLAAFSCVNIDNEKAIDLSRRAISNSVNDPLFYAGAAYVAHHIGNDGLALQAIDTALLTYPDEPKWRSLAAELAHNVGDIGKEIQHLECSLGIEPENIQINIRLAKAAIEAKNPALAVEILNGVRDLDSQNAELLHVLALAHFKNLDYDHARAICESARNLENTNFSHWLLSAQIAYETGDMPSALQFAQTSSQLNPNSTDTLYLMVQILKSSGDMVGALNVLENGIKTIRPTISLLLEQAKLVAAIDGAQAAIPLIADILEKNEGNAEIYAFLAEAQKDAGDYEGAEQTAMASLDFDPDQPGVFILLGTINNQTGHLDRAVNHFSKAIELDPEDLQGYLELGKTYQNRRDYMKALQTYQRAMIAKPIDYRPYYQAGLVLRETKNYAEAESMLRKAVDLNPQDVNIRRQLGAIVALNLVHNKEEARVAQ